jgi:two-component system chemotaxis sensor kinase CheA
MSASAVTRLFADSCAAFVVFGDENGIKEELATLGRSDDVPYAAVWAVDATRHTTKRIGELGAAGARAELTSASADLVVVRESERLVVTAPVRDPDSKLVGEAIATFSLARENATIRDTRRRTLLASAAIAAGITALLLGLARMLIVRPLAKLVVAANRIERGDSSEIEVRSNDEIGRLAAAFRSMANAIHHREHRINQRNRDMRRVLDNVEEGLLTLDAEGRVCAERSRVVDEWFGSPQKDAFFWNYIEHADGDAPEFFRLGWTAIQEDILPLELCLHQLPKLLAVGERKLELGYRPILEDNRFGGLLVIVTDVTARLARERSELVQLDTLNMVRHILSDRTAFDEFCQEAGALVAAIEHSDGVPAAELKRNIHTLKGNCAIYEIESVARFCHEMEGELEIAVTELPSARKKELAAVWSNVEQIRSQFSAADGIAVDVDEYESLLRDLARGVGRDVLAARIAAWRLEPVAKRMELLSRQIDQLAHRLGKGDVQVLVEPSRLRLPGHKWAPFWAAFTHVIRNAVDHGIETPEERKSTGKPQPPAVKLWVTQEDRAVVVGIHDDGRGIDWEEIGARAEELGLPHETSTDLRSALFANGVSSRKEVSATSGRGVGLAAILHVVRDLGGRIDVQSQKGSGTTFRFFLPDSMLVDEGHVVRRLSTEPPPADRLRVLAES